MLSSAVVVVLGWVVCLAVKVMRESRKTWRSVITFQASAALCLKECFYCTEKETASLSNYEYLDPVIWRVCSALYRLFLKGWSQTHVVIKVCLKCFSVSPVLQALSDLSQQSKEVRRSVTLLNLCGRHFRSDCVILAIHRVEL